MDRLSPEQRLRLRHLAASSAMDGVEVPPEDLEVVATYLLGDITEDETLKQMRALHEARQQRVQRQRSAWAVENGIEVPQRGRIPSSVIAQFEAANAGK